jgi:hypothetical protein
MTLNIIVFLLEVSPPLPGPIYTWVQFRIRLAHFPKYKNNYIWKNGLAYCEIALRNRTCKQARKSFLFFLPKCVLPDADNIFPNRAEQFPVLERLPEF